MLNPQGPISSIVTHSIYPSIRIIHFHPVPLFASCQSMHNARTTSAFIRYSLSVFLPFYIHARSSDGTDFDTSTYTCTIREPDPACTCLIYPTPSCNKLKPFSTAFVFVCSWPCCYAIHWLFPGVMSDALARVYSVRLPVFLFPVLRPFNSICIVVQIHLQLSMSSTLEPRLIQDVATHSEAQNGAVKESIYAHLEGTTARTGPISGKQVHSDSLHPHSKSEPIPSKTRSVPT
jgi:hypothetical protein